MFPQKAVVSQSHPHSPPQTTHRPSYWSCPHTLPLPERPTLLSPSTQEQSSPLFVLMDYSLGIPGARGTARKTRLGVTHQPVRLTRRQDIIAQLFLFFFREEMQLPAQMRNGLFMLPCPRPDRHHALTGTQYPVHTLVYTALKATCFLLQHA